jgi:hypothetical protein
MDVDARIQLFDLKTTYQFHTTPGIDKYNMPLYDLQIEPGGQDISLYPVYQGFEGPAYANGIQMPFYTQKQSFQNTWANYVQGLPQAATGTGAAADIPYQISVPFFPALPGHIDMAGIVQYGANTDPIYTDHFITNIPVTSVYSAIFFTASDVNGKNIVVADSGQFLGDTGNGDLYGLLMTPGTAPFGNTALGGGYDINTNTINYNTGVANVTFPSIIPAGNPIHAQCYFFQPGIPRALLYFDNVITLRPPPPFPVLIELDAYLTPAAFLATGASVTFAYMAEYIARGAARKIMADTGDVEQLQFYEPFFIEQERLVWKRSQRQFTSTRTNTIFSELSNQSNYNNIGQGAT